MAIGGISKRTKYIPLSMSVVPRKNIGKVCSIDVVVEAVLVVIAKGIVFRWRQFTRTNNVHFNGNDFDRRGFDLKQRARVGRRGQCDQMGRFF